MRKKSQLIFLVGSLLISTSLLAQPTISAGTAAGNENTSIVVPITADNFELVNQFSLKLSWDNLGLELTGVQDAIPGISFNIYESSLTADYDDVELTLGNGTTLFYAAFRIIGTPGSLWPLDLNFLSIQVGGLEAIGALSNNGQVSVNSLPPVFHFQYAEGLNFANVVVPITVENFENINEFNFSVHGSFGGTPFIEVQDVYPGVIIIPPAVGENILSVSYNGANITLPDNMVLFNIVYQVIGLPGANRPLLLEVTSLQASGVPLSIPPDEPGIIHIIDPSPITLHAHDVGANAGDEVVMPITISNFQEVRELNFTMTWDPSVAEYIEPDFLDSHISYMDADGSDGILQGTFLSNPHVSLANGATLAGLRFLMNESQGRLDFRISIDDARISYINAPYFGAQTVNGSFIQTHPTITVGSVSGYQNTNVLVPITADHFSDVNQLEFSLDWDNAGLTLIDVQDVLPGMLIDIAGSTVTATIPIGDSLSVSLPDSTVLFYLNFNITGDPGTSWPIDILISSLTEYDVSVNSIGQNGEVAVSIPVPVFSPQPVEGSALSTVLVPITVKNFENVDAFEFTVSWPGGQLLYDMVQDVYPGIIVTPVNNYTLSVSFDDGNLTLPDSTILFHIAFQLNGQPGTDHSVTVQANVIEAWGTFLQIPLPEVATVHVIDPDPITIIAHDVTGYVGVGQEVLMPITVSNFDDVRRIYLTLTFDPFIAGFNFVDFVDPHINYIDSNGEDGILELNFYSSLGTSLADGDTLVVLRFWKTESPSSTPFTVSAEETRVAGGFYSGVQTIDGSITIEPPLTFNIAHVSGERFSNINVPITVTNFQNVNAASFHIRWDSTKVELNDVAFEQGTSWDSVHIDDGLAFIGFTFAAPLSLADSTILINLNFGLVGEYGDSSSIVVDNALPKELIINDVISQGIAYNSGSASIDELLISGFIQYPNYENINNVRVYPSEGNGANTNEQGYYEMQFFGSGPFLSVTPYKNDPEPMNGYDMADVSAIHAYVDEPEISEITTAYQVIAADVDGDEAVEHEDADLLEMFLLGEADLPSHTLWRFVYSGHNFVDINNPYPYPDHFEAADYNTIVPGSRIDFVGLKRGDVNLSRDNTQVGRTHVSRTVTLEVNTTSFDDGITEVEVRSLDFGDVRAYQFTMSWDPNAFELLDNSLFSMGRHSGTQTSEGHITSTWQTPKAIKLTDGTTLISFMLLAKDQKATAQVSVTDAVTATHVFDASLAKLSVNVIQRVGSDEGQGVEIFPNPATSTARILIHSGHQQESSIEVSDLNGKAIYATTLMLQPGKNVLSVETEKWKKGVHLLRLRTKTRFEIKKVLKN